MTDFLLVLIAACLWGLGLGMGYLLWHRPPYPEEWVDADRVTFDPSGLHGGPYREAWEPGSYVDIRRTP
jgi:hypothetical protein